MGPNVEAAPPGVRGSSLQFANHFYPHAAALGGVRVVCACGDVIRGRTLWGPSGSAGGSDHGGAGGSGRSPSLASGSLDEGSDFGRGLQTRGGSRWDAYVAYESYKARLALVGEGPEQTERVLPPPLPVHRSLLQATWRVTGLRARRRPRAACRAAAAVEMWMATGSRPSASPNCRAQMSCYCRACGTCRGAGDSCGTGMPRCRSAGCRTCGSRKPALPLAGRDQRVGNGPFRHPCFLPEPLACSTLHPCLSLAVCPAQAAGKCFCFALMSDEIGVLQASRM